MQCKSLRPHGVGTRLPGPAAALHIVCEHLCVSPPVAFHTECLSVYMCKFLSMCECVFESTGYPSHCQSTSVCVNVSV